MSSLSNTCSINFFVLISVYYVKYPAGFRQVFADFQELFFLDSYKRLKSDSYALQDVA